MAEIKNHIHHLWCQNLSLLLHMLLSTGLSHWTVADPQTQVHCLYDGRFSHSHRLIRSSGPPENSLPVSVHLHAARELNNCLSQTEIGCLECKYTP